ncbi:MAG: hypothetical protein HWE10_00760 [Gammaproteobacteria bacterium]|nr:hypothetical protein [Gammaproteobacteria bacterium]
MSDLQKCQVNYSDRKCHRVNEMEIGSCQLEMKPESLARLLQTQQLTIDDFQCADNKTKQFVQAVLLNCIVCSSCAATKPVKKKLINRG